MLSGSYTTFPHLHNPALIFQTKPASEDRNTEMIKVSMAVKSLELIATVVVQVCSTPL